MSNILKELHLSSIHRLLAMNKIVDELSLGVMAIIMKRLAACNVMLSELSFSEAELLISSAMKEYMESKVSLHE